MDNTGQVPGTTTVLSTNTAEEGLGDSGAETASQKPQLWPEGVIVRRFYEARKPVDIKTRSATKNDCVSDARATIAGKSGLLSS